MYKIEPIMCANKEALEQEEQDDEDFHWGEGCCEDELEDDEFYEREVCD